MKNELKKAIGQNLRQLILDKDYKTVEQFAYQNGFEKSAIGKIVNGQRIPRLDTVIRIVEALDATVNDLYLSKD